jgi:rare lipoprotein A
MKRWLAALAVFAACACHVDIAAADIRPPTLWQRIVSVFAPRPALRHPAPKVVAAAKPAAEATGSPPSAERADGLVAQAPQSDPAIAAMPVETLSASPPATVEPHSISVVPTKSARKHEHRDTAKAQLHADTTGALPPMPSQAEPVTALAEPAEPTSPASPNAGAAAFKPTKKVKHDQAGYQLASLGSPGLKAALAPETAQPETAPHAPEGAFPAAPSHGSVCNVGRKVTTAYYWEGSRTASGQPFNPHAMTAAHRTLPFGTRLNVTNPRTGQTVEVIVNDRGPYVSGVGLDLSLGAAQAIGLHGTGSVCIL